MRAGLNQIGLGAFLKRTGARQRAEQPIMPVSRTLLAASVIGAASLAFAGGFAASSATAAPPSGPPIVNVNAWEETAPAAPVHAVAVRLATVEPALQSTPQCNPWDVSDIAMELPMLCQCPATSGHQGCPRQGFRAHIPFQRIGKPGCLLPFMRRECTFYGIPVKPKVAMSDARIAQNCLSLFERLHALFARLRRARH